MLDTYADVSLYFVTFKVVFLIALIFGLLHGRGLFFQIACVLSLEVLINVALKGTFRVQLSPKLHSQAFAFPSGHMQIATVFYLWCFYNIHKWQYKILPAILLGGVAIGLVRFGYHTISDVVAAFIVGIMIIHCFFYFSRKNIAYFSLILLVAGSILLLYNYLAYGYILDHAEKAYYVLLLLTTADTLREFLKNKSYWHDANLIV